MALSDCSRFHFILFLFVYKAILINFSSYSFFIIFISITEQIY